jgi:hypothetical protein
MPAKPQPVSRNVDAKGRVALGERFANRTVIVEPRGNDEVVIRLARVIPEREAWLYANPEALGSVRRGLSQARSRRFAKAPPDLKGAARGLGG